jgi:diaminopimelate decarboxylase
VQIEPGRFIVGNAGITLYTAYVRKEIPGIRTYVSVDGGMTDNIRPMLYDAEYEAVIANRPMAPTEERVHVAGRCCETGDVLIENLPLPRIKKGEVVAVFATGAYNYAMASNYNRLPIPAVVLTHEGRSGLAVRRQSIEDMRRWEHTPDYWTIR